MENVDNFAFDTNFDSFFENTLVNYDINKDMKDIYRLIEDDKLRGKINSNLKFDNLKNSNYKRYNEINLFKYKNLPDSFKDLVNDISSIYDLIDVKQILEGDFSTAKKIKTMLDSIYEKIDSLDSMTDAFVNELTKLNNERQKKFSREYINDLDIEDSLKLELIQKYEETIIQSSTVYDDIYLEAELQLKRKQMLDEMHSILNIENEKTEEFSLESVLNDLNKKINDEIYEYNSKINYLEDIMPKKSKYFNDFNSLKNYYNKIFAYDDTNYDIAKKTYETLLDRENFNDSIHNLEELFISEIEDREKEEKFIYEKIGIKNLKKSLEYIKNKYYNQLGPNSQEIVNFVSDKINSENYDISELYNKLKTVVDTIWSNTITDPYSFTKNKDFYFICSNNQFMDPKYQAILITKAELNKVNDYEDYQIGFICAYNKNILYITENDDIMTVDSEDMSDLKTPLQLEEEFINFKICNRIALNGYQTKITAVYIINDGDKDKYTKAIELANMYKLPLIELNKDYIF